MKHPIRLITVFVLIALLAITCTLALAATAEDTPPADTTESAPSQPAQADGAGTESKALGIVEDKDLDITASDHIFREEKLLLVTVSNKNESDAFSVNVKVTYYGTDNEVLGEETQSFDQLAVGFERNFIFRPGFDFVDYTLETEKTVYTGELWKTYVTDPVFVNYHGNLSVGFQNNRDRVMMGTKFRIVVFDESGEIIDILHKDALIGAAANSYRSNGLPYGYCPEECAVAGCTLGEHIYDWDNITGVSTFITYEAVLPEAHPDYDYWMTFAHLPGNVFSSNLED